MQIHSDTTQEHTSQFSDNVSRTRSDAGSDRSSGGISAVPATLQNQANSRAHAAHAGSIQRMADNSLQVKKAGILQATAAYDQQVADYHDEVAGAQGIEMEEATVTVSSPSGVQTQPWSANWICLTGLGGWKLRSYETGVIKKVSSADPHRQWAFKSIAHNSIQMEGSTLPGTSITFTQGIGTPSFTESNAAMYNYFSALMQLNFGVTYSFTPFGNCPLLKDLAQLLARPESRNYTARGAWALNN